MVGIGDVHVKRLVEAIDAQSTIVVLGLPEVTYALADTQQ